MIANDITATRGGQRILFLVVMQFETGGSEFSL